MFPPAASVGPIERFMVEDHVRLNRLLEASEGNGGSIDPAAYSRFRRDLLRHIAMEEKILLPYARAKREGEPLPTAPSLRADHGQIAKLLVRSPTSMIVGSLRELLGRHNPLEEGPDGLYAACDGLAGEEAMTIVSRLRAQPQVPVAQYYDGPLHGVR